MLAVTPDQAHKNLLLAILKQTLVDATVAPASDEDRIAREDARAALRNEQMHLVAAALDLDIEYLRRRVETCPPIPRKPRGLWRAARRERAA